jgi:putative SOS response-associated peptidase YedK
MTGKEVAAAYPEAAYPGYAAPIIHKSAQAGQDVEVATALFGLIPSWAKDRSIGKRTYNARTETIAEKPSFRNAWRQARFCLVPMEQFFEPCWETGKAVQWRIFRTDDEPFTVAGIWESWTDRETGEIVKSFSMLTINADGHPIMGRFHRPADEKRSLVIVPPELRNDWLNASAAEAPQFLVPMSEQFASKSAMMSEREASLF